MSIKSISIGIVSAAAMAVATCNAAHAGLIGDEFSRTDNAGDPEQLAFVNPTANFSIGQADTLGATIGDDTLTITSIAPSLIFGGSYILNFNDLTHSVIENVTLASLNGVTGFSSSDISFTANSITVVLPEGMSFNDGALDVVLDIETQAVPEPTSLAMFGTGVLALGFFGWRRRNRGAI